MNPINQLPESALSALNLMPNKASEIARFAHQLIKSVQNGEVSALQVIISLKAMEAVSELVMEEIEENGVKEAESYPEKKFSAFGALVEKAEIGTKYNFIKCGDPTYERLETDFNTAKSRLDERKEFLKTLRSPTPIGDTVTGELVTVNPPVKTSKSGIKIFLK